MTSTSNLDKLLSTRAPHAHGFIAYCQSVGIENRSKMVNLRARLNYNDNFGIG